VVSVNDPPRVSATDSEEACRIQANANRAHQRAEEQCQAAPPCARGLRLEFEEVGLPTFNNPKLIWAWRWHVFSRPILRPRLKQPWRTYGSPLLWWRRKARRPNRLRLRRAGTRAADLIGLRIAGSP
jgi:hypothetical protein